MDLSTFAVVLKAVSCDRALESERGAGLVRLYVILASIKCSLQYSSQRVSGLVSQLPRLCKGLLGRSTQDQCGLRLILAEKECRGPAPSRHWGPSHRKAWELPALELEPGFPSLDLIEQVQGLAMLLHLLRTLCSVCQPFVELADQTD